MKAEWKLNHINCGPPFRVELVGPYKLPQVCDARGVVAVSGPNGAVFLSSIEDANKLCELANNGELFKQ